MPARVIRCLLVVVMLALAAAPAPGIESPGHAEQGPHSGRAKTVHPKMDAHLSAISGATRPSAEARARKVPISGGSVIVEVLADPGRVRETVAEVTAAGGRVSGRLGTLVEASIDPDALEGLADHDAIEFVRVRSRDVVEGVTSEGVATTGAAEWHAAGFTGAGIDIAVFDTGFAGLAAALASGDLPGNVIEVDRCDGGFHAGSGHGTAVAEIVHDLAPLARLHLMCLAGLASREAALDYVIGEGIPIVTQSVGLFNTTRGDGSGGPGTPDSILRRAREAGVLWINSAGNYARTHWSGSFTDVDGNGAHNFTSSDEGNTFEIDGGETSCVFLKWDDWPGSDQDYDLTLERSPGGEVVARSDGLQTGSQPPTESICYENTGPDALFAAFITDEGTTAAPRLDLFMRDAGLIEHRVEAGSLNDWASLPESLAVAATCWVDDSLKPSSSRGPTVDGRVKPDLSGPSDVSTTTDGGSSGCSSGFSGTSASAPHVAGAAALLLEEDPSLGPLELQAALEGATTDLGAPGKDPSYGAGTLALPSPPEVAGSKQVALSRSRARVFPRQQVTLRAVVSPCEGHEGEAVVFRELRGATLRELGTVVTDDSCAADLSVRITGRRPRVRRFEAISPRQDEDHLSGLSNIVTVRVR